ncbi:hypothetical protein [Kitasatospora sp. NPDC059327]|uniref:hypothetical protein n=1 Tax=Kitasatospora sp. NPDC059327 TaxID=3346803 RepID=UPI00368F4C5F
MQLLVVAHASQARGLRRRVLRQLAGWGIVLDAETANSTSVVVSNLFAAALLHGVRGQTVTVRLSAVRGELTVEVMTGVTACPRGRAPHTARSGRLPAVLAVYATDSGVDDRPRGCSPGRSFWATVPVPEPCGGRRAARLRCRLGLPARVPVRGRA